ncbi:MAG TPA: hypothetical protein VH275_04915 [Solirubrobacterales bacterium]|nr:hypothetical protein [Solirubrobacterales bacterium]
MPATTITIKRDQRNGLYELVRNHLGSVGDLWTALEHDKDFATAERLGLEFGEDIELLRDIGWGKDDPRPEFELRMPEHDLMELLQRLQGEAGMLLGGWADEEREDVESKERFRRAYDACKKVLADLDPRAGDRS